MQEQLQVPSVDFVVHSHTLHEEARGAELGAWTADEISAFRQVPVLLVHWHLSVMIALCDPSCGSIRFFAMVGHPFGMTALVTNYCRRSYALNQFLIMVPTYGFHGLGVSTSPFLVIIFDLRSSILAIKPTRPEDMKLEITRALEHVWFPQVPRPRCEVNSCLVWEAWQNIPQADCRSPVGRCWRIHIGHGIAASDESECGASSLSLAKWRRGLLISSCSPMGHIPSHGTSRVVKILQGQAGSRV